MFDVTFLIPDYPEWQDQDYTPPDPYEDMPDWECERLFEDLCIRIDIGAFNPDHEILF